MLAARAVLGIGVGGFWVFGAGAAITLVSEQARGTAVAVVSSGIFIATVASLPAASLIGTLTTWRAAFAVAAVFAVGAVAAQLAAVPRLGAGGWVRRPPSRRSPPTARPHAALRPGRLSRRRRTARPVEQETAHNDHSEVTVPGPT